MNCKKLLFFFFFESMQSRGPLRLCVCMYLLPLACKHDISKQQWWIITTLDVRIITLREKNLYCFDEGQRSCDVTETL